jgi:hypothetical protein
VMHTHRHMRACCVSVRVVPKAHAAWGQPHVWLSDRDTSKSTHCSRHCSSCHAPWTPPTAAALPRQTRCRRTACRWGRTSPRHASSSTRPRPRARCHTCCCFSVGFGRSSG